MSSLFAHHNEAFFQVEVMGRSFPDGMTEHVLAYAATALVVGLLTYGAVAAVRDLVRWRRAVGRRRSSTPADLPRPDGESAS